MKERHSHSMVMAVGYTAQQLVEKALENVRLQASLAHVQILLQVLVEVLEHECEFPLRVHYIV